MDCSTRVEQSIRIDVSSEVAQNVQSWGSKPPSVISRLSYSIVSDCKHSNFDLYAKILKEAVCNRFFVLSRFKFRFTLDLSSIIEHLSSIDEPHATFSGL